VCTAALHEQVEGLKNDARKYVKLDGLVELQMKSHRLERACVSLVRALDAYMQDELGMVSFARMLANPMRFAEHEQLPASEALEMMVEVGLDTVSTLLSEVEQVVQDLKTGHDNVQLSLNVAQNRLLYWQIVLQAITASCALPTFVSGACAMNLINGFPTLNITWFWLVCALSFFLLLGE
jgi:Mg2+ and Co2+ transporter CorA